MSLFVFLGFSSNNTSALNNNFDIENKINDLRYKIKNDAEYKRRIELYLNKIKKQKEKVKEISYEKELDISEKMETKNIQQRALSCEMSAAADILTFYEWKNISEWLLVAFVSKSEYNQFPKTKDGITYWWNPNKWFVWYIDKTESWAKATQSWMTWYWVLEKPINDIYKKFWYTTKVITNKEYNEVYNKKSHLTEVLKSLSEWNMVQLRWDYCTDPLYLNSENDNKCSNFSEDRTLEWYYEDNHHYIKHDWLIWEHAFYLLWYKWWVEEPSDIIVWDTLTWKQSYPVKEWYRKRDLMQNRTIIVFKK